MEVQNEGIRVQKEFVKKLKRTEYKKKHFWNSLFFFSFQGLKYFFHLMGHKW